MLPGILKKLDLLLKLIRLRRMRKRKKKRLWVHPLLSKQPTEGEFVVLFQQLRKDEKFYCYSRMSCREFDLLLAQIKSKLFLINF